MSASIDAVLQAAVESGALPNVVGMAADDESVIYEGATGPRAAGADEPVTADSTFRIASMTKAVCAVAALQQRDRGNLDFDAPVDTYCPDFAAVQVLDGFEDGKPTMRHWWSGGHGLYSTPRDYTRFQQMLLGGGTVAGTTILDPSSVGEAFTNQIGDLWVPAEMPTTNPAWSCDFTVGPDMKWGWGLLLDTDEQPGMRAAGSGSWAGIFTTHFWVDPHAMIAGALYTQALPFAAPAALRTYADFERAVYEAAPVRHTSA